MSINITKLIISILIPQVTGAIAGLVTASSVSTWFQTLNKPSFNPPSWLFSPVWITLYLMMGISLYLVSTSESINKDYVVKLFYVQLLFNFLWSILFFGLKNPLFAFVDILILLILIVLYAFKSYKVNNVSGLLFVPYILWVSFASILNLAIVYLNW